MTLDVVQRLVALAAVALAACVGALALSERGSGQGSADAGPRPVPAPGGGWYTALGGSRGAPGERERTTCGLVLTGRSLGVSHPTLPCGAKIYLAYGSDQVLTEVIDNRLKQSGRQFELTEALARRFGVEGTQELRWRFATR
ncbi:MAG TPA: hypothetical protein VEY87_08730 [Gaiellaceae bacterium]|jgi:hypothetical protein|nr:hypothetical protein [Gaiellaceae bacterium]